MSIKRDEDHIEHLRQRESISGKAKKMEIRGIKQIKCGKVSKGGTPFISKSFALATVYKGKPLQFEGLRTHHQDRLHRNKQSHVYFV